MISGYLPDLLKLHEEVYFKWITGELPSSDFATDIDFYSRIIANLDHFSEFALIVSTMNEGFDVVHRLIKEISFIFPGTRFHEHVYGCAVLMAGNKVIRFHCVPPTDIAAIPSGSKVAVVHCFNPSDLSQFEWNQLMSVSFELSVLDDCTVI